METIAKIPGYPKYYASTTGDIYSKWSGELKKLAFSTNKWGHRYTYLSLGNGQRQRRKQTHRLVAQTFIPNPQNKPFINHIDCDPTNNRVENLEWCTPAENVQHAAKNGRMGTARGIRNGNHKVDNNKVLKIRELYKTGMFQEDIAKIFGVCQSTIGRIVTGKTWAKL